MARSKSPRRTERSPMPRYALTRAPGWPTDSAILIASPARLSPSANSPSSARAHTAQGRLGGAREAAVIADGEGEAFGLPEVLEDRRQVPERNERAPEVEPEVDGPRGGLLSLGHMLDADQGLLEVRGRLAKGAAPARLPPRLPEVAERLVPDLAPEGVVGEALDLRRKSHALAQLLARDLHKASLHQPAPECRGVPDLV